MGASSARVAPSGRGAHEAGHVRAGECGDARPRASLFVWTPTPPDTCLEPSDDLIELVFVVDHLDGEFLDGLVEVFLADSSRA